MKAARVTSWTSPPEYITVPDLPPPSANELQLKVLAVGVPRAVRGRAACKHPSAFGAPLPFDPSIDGVGIDQETGDMYFMSSLTVPFFAERANIARDQLVKLSPETDPIAVAAMANPFGSSWMALQCRAIGGCRGRTVAIVGATSASGRAGAYVAHYLGASRVVGISRNAETLAGVEGLDERVVLNDDFSMPAHIGPVHIVLDWVGGPTAIRILRTAQIPSGENLQYIQVGGLAGYENIDIPGRLINIKPIIIMASGVGSFSEEDLKREMHGLVGAITKMGKNKLPFEVFVAPMSDVQQVWECEEASQKRLVLVP